MENPKKTNHKLNDIANIMDDILSNMKSHIKHIQKKDGDKNAPQIYKDVDPNTFDQSRTLQNILNYTLKDPIYMKNGNKDEALLTDIEKKEILANAFIKINPYLKSPNTNLAQSINPNLNTLEELIQQTNKDIALGKNPTKTVPPKSSLHKQATETTNLLTNKTDSSQSNRLSRKTTTKYSNQQKSTSYNNNVKPIIVTTKVQNSQSPINEIKPRSSSSQKRKASEKIDSKQQTQSISSKATTNRRSVQNSPPTSERSGTRKPLNDVNNNSTNFRSRSLSVQNDTTNPRNIQTNKYFNETRRPSTAVPVTRGKPTTAVSSTRDRLTTAMVKNKPSAAISSKDRPSTNTSSKNRSSAAKTSMPFKIQSSTAKSNIKPLSKISPTRDKVASPVPIAKGRPMSMDSKLRPQNQGKLDTKTFPQKTSNKITTRTRSMDSKPVSRPEAPKIFPKIISNDSNNYSLSNDSKNTMRKEFSGVKNHEFIKDLTKQISQVIRKNNQMLMEKRAIYVQGTIPSNFIVNRAVTSVEKKIDQLIKPISTNVINQIISKQNSAQTKVINQPVNSDIFPSKSENKKEINNNEIHKLIPTNTKLIENIEKSNYHVNKTIEKQLENVESITKKSVSFQNRKPVGPPKVVIEQQNRPQTSPFLGNWLQTPERKPQTSAGAQILHEKRGIQSSPTLELKRDEEGTKIFPQQIHIEKSKTSAETPAVLAENNEQNIESINEINKQIEQMMIQVVGPKMENSKENTPSNLNEETPKLNILDPVKSKQEKEEPPKPQSQIIVPCAKKSSRYTSKSTNFFKPFTPESKYSFQKKLSIIPLAPMSKRFLPTPMELVQDFINMVAQAKKAKKTYTVCGNFFALRRAFAERGWIEKMRINIMDDKESWRKIESLTNYELVEGIRNKEYGEKYRRMFLTKLLAGHQVDFYWDYLTNPFNINNDRIKRTLINRFPYGATRSYTTKHGLSESLKESHWFRIEGYANILFPRTYNLAIDEEIKSFIDDFRITGAISLLQWILNTTSDKVQSAEGTIPISVFNFATMQCHHFLKEREHRDIDELIPMTKDCEWDVFLDKYYKLVHFDHMFQKNDKISIEAMIDQSRYIMNKIKKYLPDVNIDGYRNMWLLKPNNGSRGYGILVCRTLKYMLDAINSKKDIKYIVQKYIGNTIF